MHFFNCNYKFSLFINKSNTENTSENFQQWLINSVFRFSGSKVIFLYRNIKEIINNNIKSDIYNDIKNNIESDNIDSVYSKNNSNITSIISNSLSKMINLINNHISI